MILEELVSRLQNPRRAGKGYSCRCPGHDDKKNSLSVDQADGKILIKCYAGCETGLILGALGLNMADLFASNGNGHEPVVETYPYHDETGNPLFRICRTASKGFKAQSYKGGAFVWQKLGETRRVLYNLPAVIKSEAIIVVEGEKDVETLRKLGLVATTNPFGTGEWDDSYNQFFKNKRVVILPDNDDPGRAHGWRIAKSIISVAESIRLIEFPNLPEKGDVTDYLANHTKSDLLKIIRETKQLTVDKIPQVKSKDADRSETNQTTGAWDKAQAAPDFCSEEEKNVDGLAKDLIVPGAITNVAAPRGIGKTLVAHAVGVAMAKGGYFRGEKINALRVLIVDRDNPRHVVGKD
jgi:putative DNA primase/helicase